MVNVSKQCFNFRALVVGIEFSELHSQNVTDVLSETGSPHMASAGVAGMCHHTQIAL